MRVTVIANFKKYPVMLVGSKRRAKYYKEGDILPAKYQDLVYYDFVEGTLYDLNTMLPVIKNNRTAGVERIIHFSGNKLHSTTSGHLTAAQIADINKIKGCIKEYILKHLPSSKTKTTLYKFPICIELLFRCRYNSDADMDNLKLFYEKVILDCIQTLIYEKVKGQKRQRAVKVHNPKGILNNDNLEHIFRLESQATFIENNEERTLTLIAKEYTHAEHSKIEKYAERFSRTSAGTVLYSTVPNLEIYEGVPSSTDL